MNKQELKTQTVKYFIQQKVIEFVLLMLVVPTWYLLARLAWLLEGKGWTISNEGRLLESLSGFWGYLGYGFLGLFLIILIIFWTSLIILICYYLYKRIVFFIKWNWEMAEERARKKLK